MLAGGCACTTPPTSGRAEYQPVAENDTPEGRKKNRRIEITLIDKNLVQEAGPVRK